MEESEDNLSAEEINSTTSPTLPRAKPKKRSLVERELETSLTTRITSPITNGEATSTSRYGRARRLKNDDASMEIVTQKLLSPKFEKSPTRNMTAYKMHASNSPIKTEMQIDGIDNQIENIYNQNISLSRFGSEGKKSSTSSKKQPKIYIRKDLIQSKEKEETIVLIKNMFSPTKANSAEKASYNTKKADLSSVVKTLDFDCTKKSRKKESGEKRMSQSDLFELEATCEYQVGDLAWARMGSYPFWPCIITREPTSSMFVKKKLYGRLEKDVIHVTFLGDNGSRSWILESMLRKYMGLQEFETTRDQFSSEAKKKDPRLYAAFFISEKKLPNWYTSVEEAETLLKEPKRLRMDSLNALLTQPKLKALPTKSRKITRTNSDVSLSESLYDSLFSEDDCKNSDSESTRAKSRNKSFDVSDVVTACLDSMAAKTGITKIQKQSHMDRWLQKAKSNTPEKAIHKPQSKSERKSTINKLKTPLSSSKKRYSLRNCNNEQENDENKVASDQSEHEHSLYSNGHNVIDEIDLLDSGSNMSHESSEPGRGIGIICKIETLAGQETVCNNTTDNIPTSSNTEKYEKTETDVVNTDSYLDPSAINEEINQENVNTTDENKMQEDEEIDNDVQLKRKNNCESNNIENINVKETVINNNSKSDLTKEKQNDIDNLTDKTEENQCNNINDKCKSEANRISIEKFTPSNNKASDLEDNRSILINLDKSEDTSSNREKSICSGEEVDINHDTLEGKLSKSVVDNICESVNELKDESVSHMSVDGSSCSIQETNDPETSTSALSEVAILAVQNIDQSKQDDKEYKEENLINENDKMELKENVENNDKSNKIDELTSMEVDNDRNDITCETNNVDDNSALGDIQLNNKKDVELNGDSKNEEKVSEDESKLDVQSEYTEDKYVQSNDENLESYNQIQSKVNSNSDECDTQASNEINNIDNLNSSTDGHENEKDICIDNGNETPQNSEVCSRNYKDNCETSHDINKSIDIIDPRNKNYINSEVLHLNGHISPVCVNATSSESLSMNECEEQNQNSHIEDEDVLDNSKQNPSLLVAMNGTNSLEFLKYVERKQDDLIDEHPELSPEEITNYLYKTWQYEESLKTDRKRSDDNEHFVKGLPTSAPKTTSKKGRKKVLQLKSGKKQTLINFETAKKNNIEEIREVLTESNNISKFEIQMEEKDNEIQSSEACIQHPEVEESVTTDSINNKNTEHNDEIQNKYLTNSTNDPQKQLESDGTSNECIIEKVPSTFETKLQNEEISSQLVIQNGFCENSSDSKQIDDDKSDKNTKNTDEISKEDSRLSEVKEPLHVSVNDETSTAMIQDTQERNDQEFIINSADHDDSELSDSDISDIPSGAVSPLSVGEGPTKKDFDALSVNSESSGISLSKKKGKGKEKADNKIYQDNPEFLKYLELRQDAVMDEHPELSQDEITSYLYNTWLYEESVKTDRKKTDDFDQTNLVKGLNQEPAPVKRVRKKKEKAFSYNAEEVVPKDKSRRRTERQFYREDFSDYEDDFEYFEIFKTKSKSKPQVDISVKKESNMEEKVVERADQIKAEEIIKEEEFEEVEQFDQVEEYFRQLTQPKPNLFKGLIRERVCEVCEKVGGLVKCKSCSGMFHVECDKRVIEKTESPLPNKGRKKKKKNRGRKLKGLDDSNDDHSDDRHDYNNSDDYEHTMESRTIADAEEFESKISAKLQEMLDNAKYDSNSSDEELHWSDADVGKCKIVDIIPRKKKRQPENMSDFKCKNCIKFTTPVCFVCKGPTSPKNKVEHRQKCQVAHCNQHYHLECLEHWPQTQFSSGELSRNGKKGKEYSETLTCPRHVCHTCVCDDPRGCKTRFSGDKLAKCVRCPATYHTFTKCLPAGSQILTGSHIICPRHYENRPGKVPCHVNTGWCFICALGGTLICCEYCPTSFHAECLNIKPPEGGYMCEDCETGCLPLYGEMVWVKLGHYRWWPGLILHPSEIPENILAVKHYPGEFVVRFFGQYDHYWVNRGRVFPFQEGDTGKISSKNSKIDAAFAMAVEHAQRAYEIIKDAKSPSNEGDEDIASSLLPPHYVKLKVNRPLGSVCARRPEEQHSLTQCECDPAQAQPCGPSSQCLNRMLLTECGPACRAGDRCCNRAFERREYPLLQPARTSYRGWGLRTLEPIAAGQFVIEYVGELIDEAEFQRRMRRKHEVRDENYYFLTLDKERMIDAGPKGNLARFMNHSCDPNCETQKWTVLGDVRVGLFALHDIPANSELTFNYNLECAGIEKKRCLCGTKRCSGFMGAKPKQDESQTKKNKVAAKRTYKKRKPIIELSPSTNQNKKRGRPKVRELTEIEKDLLIIKSATKEMSSDSESSGRLNSIDSVNSVKRKRLYEEMGESSSPSSKRQKNEHKSYDVE